jgi:hypothetical protein
MAIGLIHQTCPEKQELEFFGTLNSLPTLRRTSRLHQPELSSNHGEVSLSVTGNTKAGAGKFSVPLAAMALPSSTTAAEKK